MPFCENCGTKLSDTANFCPNCGKQVGKNSLQGNGESTPKPVNGEISKNDLIAFLNSYATVFSIIENSVKGFYDKGNPASELNSFINWSDYTIDRTVFLETLLDYANGILSRDNKYSVEFSIELLEQKSPALKSLFLSSAFLNFYKLSEMYIPARDTYLSCQKNNGHLFIGFLSSPKIVVPLPSFPIFNVTNDDELKNKAQEYDIEKFFDDIARFNGRVYYKTLNLPRSSNITGAFLEYTERVTETKKVGVIIKRDVSKEVVKTIQSSIINDFYCALCSGIICEFEFYYEDFKRSLKYPLTLEASYFNQHKKPELGPIFALFDCFDDLLSAIKPIEKSFSLPRQYRSSKHAIALARIILDGKADTWKEAMNLYDTETYRAQVLSSLKDIKAELIDLHRSVQNFGMANLSLSSSILGEMKTANQLLEEQRKKLSSVATSSFITAVFGN